MTYEAPLKIHREAVHPDWIDYNGHMNVAYYNLAFDHAVDQLFDLIDIGTDYAQRTNHSAFVVESHVNYIREVVEGDPLGFTLQLLDMDEKRLHYFIRMSHAVDKYLAATSEQLSVHVDLAARRTVPMPAAVQRRLAAILQAHAGLERPPEVGRAMVIRRKQEAAE
jgi:acyl-CoA thioester hydrolase